MNAESVCHEVTDCPGLFVDAFRGRFLRETRNAENTFVLTHYHGDHYQSLPRDGKYVGPARVHCTPVTAALLTGVHGVPAVHVAAHEYGETFEHRYEIENHDGGDRTVVVVARVTFYDANHCPGACVVLIESPGSGTAHLHTGDMRYDDDKFRSYTKLREIVSRDRCLDTVWLDTTYADPRHDFRPQHEVVEDVSDQAESLFGDAARSNERLLVLLSCYSIGKEKVLWRVADKTRKLLYVTEKKMRMLDCVRLDETHESFRIVERCTGDPNESDVHVVPMGLCGDVFPYFQPNFAKCKEYVEKLDKDYDKVVAFLPTGWANASKWNKEHGISQKEVTLSNGNKLHVEVRLISYSEHSSFQELVDCVKYLRPKKIVPTVFSGEADYRKIEGRFQKYLDSNWAKMAFIGQLKKGDSNRGNSSANTVSKKIEQNGNIVASNEANDNDGNTLDTSLSLSTDAVAKKQDHTADTVSDKTDECVKDSTEHGDDSEISDSIASLKCVCNVSAERATELLEASNGDLTRAIDIFFHQKQSNNEDAQQKKKPTKRKVISPVKSKVSEPSTYPTKKQARLESFFTGSSVLVSKKEHQAPASEISRPKTNVTTEGNQDACNKGQSNVGGTTSPQINPVNSSSDVECVSFKILAETLQRITDTTKRLLKLEYLETFMRDIILNTQISHKASVLSCALQITLGFRSSADQSPLEVSGSAVSKSLRAVLGVSQKQLSHAYRQFGDLGDTAASFYQTKTNYFVSSTSRKTLSIVEVYDSLQQVVRTSGRDSKQNILLKLLRACDSESELRFLVRILVGNMRIGANIRSVLAALAMAVLSSGKSDGLNTKDAVELVQNTHDVFPNLKLIISSLLQGGFDRMKNDCRMRVLTPVAPMLAHPAHELEEVEKLMTENKSGVVMEWKYDGVRCQAHSDGASTKLFSRHLLETTTQYPDAVKHILDARNNPKEIDSFILDAEIVAVEKTSDSVRLLPFQDLSKRKKKNGDEQVVRVKVFVFDLLFLNGNSCTDFPLWKRQQHLHAHFNETENFAFVSSQTLPTYDENQITTLLEKAVSGGAEGLMVKLLGNTNVDDKRSDNCEDKSEKIGSYESGSRSNNWLKVKRDYVAGYADTIDVVPIGAWYGNGRKAQKAFLSPVLLAVYDEDEDVYRSISRCLSFTDAMYEAMKKFYIQGVSYPFETDDTEMLDTDNRSDSDDESLRSSGGSLDNSDETGVNCFPDRPSSAVIITNESPSIWFKPLEVFEVSFADLTLSRQHTAAAGLIDDPDGRGIALRFPRFKRRRPDKRPDQATTTYQIAQLFMNQSKRSSA